MGIPSYFSYLVRNHKRIINTLNNNKTVINNFYLDCNSIIYDSISSTEFININDFEAKLIEKIINQINTYIKLIKPTDCIIIAFDGVPPIAKLMQQKNRRYKSWFQNNLFNQRAKWDTCAITPGTQFMQKMGAAIDKEYRSKNYKYGGRCDIILSLSDEPGEGEHKIYEYIRTNAGEGAHMEKNVVIYGIDADLIMLSLNHLKYCKSIYLFRETPEFIKSIDNTLEPNNNYLIDINELAGQIHKQMNNGSGSAVIHSSIEDYIFICFLLGNDFMPHFPAINIRTTGFSILFDLYKTLFGSNTKTLIKDGKICWGNLRTFIGKLAEQEYRFIKDMYKHREKMEKKYYPENTDEEKIHKFVSTPTWERNIEKFINPSEEYWQYRYYYSLFDIKIDGKSDAEKNAIANICVNYLETLEWTYYYYTKGCVNWTHSYKYHYPPLLIDLYKHMPCFDTEFIVEKPKTVLHPYILLANVLPRNSLNLLPRNIHNYLLKNYENYYREDYEFVYAFCRYFWEGHTKFNCLDIAELEKGLGKLLT